MFIILSKMWDIINILKFYLLGLLFFGPKSQIGQERPGLESHGARFSQARPYFPLKWHVLCHQTETWFRLFFSPNSWFCAIIYHMAYIIMESYGIQVCCCYNIKLLTGFLVIWFVLSLRKRFLLEIAQFNESTHEEKAIRAETGQTYFYSR